MKLLSRKQNRLPIFLYREGCFFVTINVQHHENVFGEVIDEEMKLNEYGKIIEECRLRLGKQYEYVGLGDFIVMPNHFHGLIYIDNVGNGRDRSLQQKGLSSLMGAFKTVSSKKIHEAGLDSFKWQKSFYDHIIRNEEDLQNHQQYIEFNAYARKNDEYYK